ncbi:hypothetical protein QYE76_002039 [Lolium multiflorum]|uniref:Uncharacterized protein n=1 Tax=Lolium multiflorum TaxID=4521 RepID=A0AAD8VZ61_LOLMU|nr:hypothetical protein QYE76_002039 [Lolium multiflorum]
MLGSGPSVMGVFISGKLFGGTHKVMSRHLGGELVPMLKNAGALWLDHSNTTHHILRNKIRVKNTSAKYGVNHRVASPYHPQTSGQVELNSISTISHVFVVEHHNGRIPMCTHQVLVVELPTERSQLQREEEDLRDNDV